MFWIGRSKIGLNPVKDRPQIFADSYCCHLGIFSAEIFLCFAC